VNHIKDHRANGFLCLCDRFSHRRGRAPSAFGVIPAGVATRAVALRLLHLCRACSPVRRFFDLPAFRARLPSHSQSQRPGLWHSSRSPRRKLPSRPRQRPAQSRQERLRAPITLISGRFPSLNEPRSHDKHAATKPIQTTVMPVFLSISVLSILADRPLPVVRALLLCTYSYVIDHDCPTSKTGSGSGSQPHVPQGQRRVPGGRRAGSEVTSDFAAS